MLHAASTMTPMTRLYLRALALLNNKCFFQHFFYFSFVVRLRFALSLAIKWRSSVFTYICIYIVCALTLSIFYTIIIIIHGAFQFFSIRSDDDRHYCRSFAYFSCLDLHTHVSIFTLPFNQSFTVKQKKVLDTRKMWRTQNNS